MDKTWEIYTGTYYFFGLAFHLKLVEGTLLSAVVGVPEGYEVRLEPVGEHSFRMLGGPFNGAVGHFLFTEDGAVAGFETGGMTFNRIDPDELEHLELVERLEAPPFELTPEKQAAFEALYRDQVESGTSPESRVMLFDPDQEVGEIVEEFIALNQDLMPGVVYAFDPGPPPALSIEKMPPAMVQVFDAGVEKREGLEFGN